MPPRGFTNPAPKTDSARSALTSFHCTLCNKSYSRHPEYEAHISSYDHQHKKRLKDLKVLSRDPNAAERARKAERKADMEAGLVVVDSGAGDGGVKRSGGDGGSGSGSGAAGSGGFKKGGFKSSFTKIGAPAAGTASSGSGGGAAAVKNVLGGDDEDGEENTASTAVGGNKGRDSRSKSRGEDVDVEVESDTDEEYGADTDGGGYYNPRKPTDCFAGCAGVKHVAVA